MNKKIFLLDHGFETVESKEPPDFNRWLLATALASVDAGVEEPFLEEAISIADRHRLPTLEDPFGSSAPQDPSAALTAAHIGSMLHRAREITPWSPAESLRLAEEARVAAAGLRCSRELKHDLVGYSLVVEANVLRLENKHRKARAALTRGTRLLAVGAGSLDAAAYALGRRSQLEQVQLNPRRAALAAGYAALMYRRLRLLTEAGGQHLLRSHLVQTLGDSDLGLSLLNRAAALLPEGHYNALGIPSSRAFVLSGLGQKDAAIFELGLSRASGGLRPELDEAKECWRSGIVERDSGSSARAREDFSRSVRDLGELGSWKEVAMVLEEFALLERSVDRPGAMVEKLNQRDEVVRRHAVPAKYLDLESFPTATASR